VGGDVYDEMCKRGLGCEEKGKAKQQATGDGFGIVCRSKGKK